MREERTLAQRVQMALVCAAIFGTGVLARVLNPERLRRPWTWAWKAAW